MRRQAKNVISRRKNTARVLLFLNAVLWFVYCIYIYYDMAVVNNNKTSADVASIFLFVMALLMFVSGVMLGKQPKRFFYFVLIVVILNAGLALTNLSNLLYLSALVIDVVILSTLLSLRREYFSIS